MRQLLNAGIVIGMAALLSCGSTDSNKNTPIAQKKSQLEQLKQQEEKLNTQISTLEAEIVKEDPSFGVKAKLVTTTVLDKQNFSHYIDLQGKISTENIFYVSPKGQGGQVKAVYVKQGDMVNKGQLLLKLDDAVMLQNLKQLETQEDFAKNIYNRQKNLWDQGIGTEVQLITAKNNVDNIEKQIATMREQWNTSSVYAEVAGVAETVNVHPGEIFTGGPANGISIVNISNLKVVVDVPENYLSSVKKGTNVIVEVPDVNKQFNSTVSLVSQLISANSRAFTAEAKVPSTKDLKPNQLALIRIQDYQASNVIVIPMITIQTDETGKYVFVMASENGKKIARKRTVNAGAVYGDRIEIRQGLQPGDQLISSGFQDLYDGQLITTAS